MINRKIQLADIGLVVDGWGNKEFTPDMSIRKLGLTLRATYTNGGTAVTNSTLLALGMWEVVVEINNVAYHSYSPESILRINEARGYIPESTDCNAIGSSTAGTVYAVFELPVMIVKTDTVKSVNVRVRHTTTGAGSTNPGTVTAPYMDLTIFYDDTVPYTTKFVSFDLPSGTNPEKSLPVEGLLDMVTVYGAADYITKMQIIHNSVSIVDYQNFKMYVKDRTLRLQGTRKGYGEAVDVDNIPVELNTTLKFTNSTPQALKCGLLYIAEVDADLIQALTIKSASNIGKDTVSVIATELEQQARINGVDILNFNPDHPYGEV